VSVWRRFKPSLVLSKPVRGAVAHRRRAFQALIGTVQTSLESSLFTSFHVFQALIGTVQTEDLLDQASEFALFQALIGTVQTRYPNSKAPENRRFKPS